VGPEFTPAHISTGRPRMTASVPPSGQFQDLKNRHGTADPDRMYQGFAGFLHANPASVSGHRMLAASPSRDETESGDHRVKFWIATI